jgi:hypothetical protein
VVFSTIVVVVVTDVVVVELSGIVVVVSPGSVVVDVVVAGTLVVVVLSGRLVVVVVTEPFRVVVVDGFSCRVVVVVEVSQSNFFVQSSDLHVLHLHETRTAASMSRESLAGEDSFTLSSTSDDANHSSTVASYDTLYDTLSAGKSATISSTKVPFSG